MHNNKKLTLSAPLSGPIIKLALVPDEVFSSGVMGDGIAIDPLNDCLYAPCDGVIVHVAKTAHALTLRADNGAEVLLHVGLDTFDLQGEGFQLLVENGEQISNGQPLVRFDPDYIAQRCTSLISLLVLTNGDRFALQLLQHDTAVAGEPLLQIAARQIEAAVTATDSSQGQAQGSVRITHHGGLHARPAALIRQTALGFKSTCRLHIGANSAPCDSIVRLLALGISEHDEVQVSCAGEDADAALQAILAALAKDQVRPAAATLKVLPAVARPINQEGQLNGVSAAPGLASGALYFLSTVQLPPDLGNHLPEEQMQALHSALEQVRAEIRLTLIQARAQGNLDEEEIGRAHV